MKAVVASFVFLLVLGACSGSSSGGGGGPAAPTTPFEKATAGSEWTSECQTNQHGSDIEKLTLNPGGNGAVTTANYKTQDCSGQVTKTDGPTNFTYTAATTDQNGVTAVTINRPGSQSVNVEVSVQGDVMTVSYNNHSVKYTRPHQEVAVPAPGSNGGGGAAPGSFEAAAAGNWLSKDCYQGETAGVTVRFTLVLSTGGHGSYSQNNYQSPSCQGASQATPATQFIYTVDNYANGGGQITVGGQTQFDVSFSGSEMYLSGTSGSTTYVRTP
jgi:hypothetical protein